MIISGYRGVAVCVLVVACRSESASDLDSLAAAPPATVVATPAQRVLDTAGTPCPHNGRWSVCTVERRLRQAGFVVKPVAGEPVKRAGFSVTPAVYTLGRARVELFVYPDEASLARDLARMDTITVAPTGIVTAWETNPVLVRSGNLAAVLLSQNQRQVERFSLAITAGAPQAGSPR